ncbi:gluconate 2-dehydrogenase subunit 3 family protein [Winogradskyella sp. A2]|uniref:gluconate 2-dehydrogenase subunit 3 family protein n=1 Tax=Winogradskyella sp. A2 TaxID=3366944 RepID=UPI00398C62C1
MKRRDAIKGLGLSFGALLVGSSALSLLQSCSKETGPIWEPVYFNKNQTQLLNKITDIILPKTVDSPSATEVNVPQFIDKFIKEAYEVEAQDVFKQGFTNLCNVLMKNTELEDLSDVKPEDIETVLAQTLKISKEEEKVFWESFEEAIENEKPISDVMATYVALNDIRGLCIFAYTNSETVGKEILVYKPVPGKQEGCIDLSETDGKAYSLFW